MSTPLIVVLALAAVVYAVALPLLGGMWLKQQRYLVERRVLDHLALRERLMETEQFFRRAGDRGLSEAPYSNDPRRRAMDHLTMN